MSEPDAKAERWVPVYRCRNCGATFEAWDDVVDVEYGLRFWNRKPFIASYKWVKSDYGKDGVMQYRDINYNVVPAMGAHHVHECGGGQVGVGDLIRANVQTRSDDKCTKQ